jgi:hypothetical protein
VGEEAAPDLAEYFQIWERFWTRRVVSSRWFNEQGQYLGFHVPEYMALVSKEDIDQSRSLLEAVVTKSGTPRQRKRAELLMQAFTYYEASASAYLAEPQAASETVTSAKGALDALSAGEQALAMAERRRRLVYDDFAGHPVLNHHGFKPDKYASLAGRDWGASLFWLARPWLGDPGVERRVRALASAFGSSWSGRHARAMLAESDETALVSANPSFEQGRGGQPADWQLWIKDYRFNENARIESVQAQARTGRWSLRCRGVARGGPLQTLSLPPGRYVAVAFAWAPRSVGYHSLTLSAALKDADQKTFPDPPSIEVSPLPAVWTPIVVEFEIPDGIDGRRIEGVSVSIIINGFNPDREVYLDDIGVYRRR